MRSLADSDRDCRTQIPTNILAIPYDKYKIIKSTHERRQQNFRQNNFHFW